MKYICISFFIYCTYQISSSSWERNSSQNKISFYLFYSGGSLENKTHKINQINIYFVYFIYSGGSLENKINKINKRKLYYIYFIHLVFKASARIKKKEYLFLLEFLSEKELDI